MCRALTSEQLDRHWLEHPLVDGALEEPGNERLVRLAIELLEASLGHDPRSVPKDHHEHRRIGALFEVDVTGRFEPGPARTVAGALFDRLDDLPHDSLEHRGAEMGSASSAAAPGDSPESYSSVAPR